MDMMDEDTYKVTIRMFMEFGLISQFQIPYRVSEGAVVNVQNLPQRMRLC